MEKRGESEHGERGEENGRGEGKMENGEARSERGARRENNFLPFVGVARVFCAKAEP